MTAEQQKNNMTDFCKKQGLKRQAFSAYVCDINPRKLGVRPGRPQLLSEQDEHFITDVIIMNDRANQGVQCQAHCRCGTRSSAGSITDTRSRLHAPHPST